MTDLSFRNGRILTGLTERGQGRFVLDGGTIAAIDTVRDGDAIDLGEGWLVPGFVDTQVNGGGGVLFNDQPTVATIERIGAAHVRFGTTAFLPTLISDTLTVVERGLDAVDAAIEQGVPGCVGIHVEGPFLNVARKGIHDARHFRPLDEQAIELLTRPRRGVVMVTLAPEVNPPEAVARLVDAGVIVSIGHSDASYEQARGAIANGARGVTHLYNAMSPLHHREPGVVGAVLEDRTLWCGLILDNIHVHPAAVRAALAARPRDRFMLVTDAMSTVGSDDASFMLNGVEITVKDGVCVDANGTLAGSALDMAQAVRNAVAMGIGMGDAVAMASTNPAAFMGLSDRIGTIAPGHRADLVWLDGDLGVRGVWIGGQRVVG